MVGKNAGTKRIDMSDKSWEVEIERINGEVKLINQKLEIIENNHLAHIQRDLDRLNKVLWVIGIMVFSQLIYVVRGLLF